MQANDLEDILGGKIPDALKAAKALERAVMPHLVKVQANRDKLPPELATKLDEAMGDIEKAKKNIRKYGH